MKTGSEEIRKIGEGLYTVNNEQKEIQVIAPNLYSVESEPGDMTHYSFFVYRDGPDEFCFMPKRSTFRFPQRLNYFDCKDLSNVELYEKAGTLSCNVHTLKECIRVMEKLKGETSL